MINYHFIDKIIPEVENNVNFDSKNVTFTDDDVSWLINALSTYTGEKFGLIFRSASYKKYWDKYTGFIDYIINFDEGNARKFDIDIYIEIKGDIVEFYDIDVLKINLDDVVNNRKQVHIVSLHHFKNPMEVGLVWVPNSVYNRGASFYSYIDESKNEEKSLEKYVMVLEKSAMKEEHLRKRNIVLYVSYAMKKGFAGLFIETGALDCIVVDKNKIASLKKQIDSSDVKSNVKSVMSESFSVREETEEKIEKENDSKRVLARLFPKIIIDYSANTFVDPEDQLKRDGSTNVKNISILMSEAKKYYKSTPENERREMVNAVNYIINKKRDREKRLDEKSLDTVYKSMRSSLVNRYKFLESTTGTTIKEMFSKITGMYSFKGISEQFMITNEPISVLQKSTGVDWEEMSCEKWNGIHKEGIYDDISKLNCTVFIVDPVTRKKYARMMIRWCLTEKEKPDVGIEEYWYYSLKKGKGTRVATTSNNIKISPNLTAARATAILVSILESKKLYKYETCVTPYAYGGWSDTEAAPNIEISYMERKSALTASGIPVRSSPRSVLTKKDIDKLLKLPKDKLLGIARMENLDSRVALAIVNIGDNDLMYDIALNASTKTEVLDVIFKNENKILLKAVKDISYNVVKTVYIEDYQEDSTTIKNANILESVMERGNKYSRVDSALGASILNAISGSTGVELRDIAPKISLLKSLLYSEEKDIKIKLAIIYGVFFWALSVRKALLKPAIDELRKVFEKYNISDRTGVLEFDSVTSHAYERGVYIPIFTNSSSRGIPINRIPMNSSFNGNSDYILSKTDTDTAKAIIRNVAARFYRYLSRDKKIFDVIKDL